MIMEPRRLAPQPADHPDLVAVVKVDPQDAHVVLWWLADDPRADGQDQGPGWLGY